MKNLWRKLKDFFFGNLANFITCLRLIFSVAVSILALSNNRLLAVFILVVVSSLSDWLDGVVARWLKIVSSAGGVLDRLADKVFFGAVITASALVYWPSDEIPWFIKTATETLVVVAVFLEVLLFLSGGLGLVKGLDVRSNQWGKRKMFLQYSAAILWFGSLLAQEHWEIKVLPASLVLIDIVLLFAVLLAGKSIEGYLKEWQTFQNM